ncbi:cyclase [Streptomyces gardneri]|uniref:Cyclase n=1 Tax=Streptomyces gardneri TaxID=66892 RepID=A0A4Y3RBS4_9ACTN|nr:cyclase [Streptomyces gardneri]GHG96272.1 cyclase [Streptomyces gardneri]
MSMVKQTIDVDVPLRNAYNQWTQFEEFPQFMEGVEDVTQVDDRHCHWQTKVAGVRREFDTEIVDQLPDERISWRTVGGDVQQKGVVTFQSLDESHTRVSLAMDMEPSGMAEKAADALGILDRRVKGDLKRFKGFMEDHEHETGAWRGRIRPSDAAAGAPPTPTDAPVREAPGPMGTPGPGGMPSRGQESWPLPPGEPGDPGLR